MKDGWHDFHGLKAWVEDGKVYRLTDGDRTLYPYRANRREGGMDLDTGITLAALYAGWRRGTIDVR